MPLDLLPHQVSIAKMLFLEPVLRFLLAKRLITQESSDTIKNQYTNQSAAARNTALVEHINEDESKVKGFMEALRQTGQAELAQLIETDNEGDSVKTRDSEESERSERLRAKHWKCPGLPGVEQCPRQSAGQWENVFEWCRHRECRRYLCAPCLQSERHGHRPGLRVGIKALHAAAYEKAQMDDAKEKRKLCKFADDIGQKVSETLQNYLLTQWNQQSSLRAFEEHLFVNLAAPPAQLLRSITSREARAALSTATNNMGGSVPQPRNVVPKSLRDLLTSEASPLLARLLAPGDALNLQDYQEEPAEDLPHEQRALVDEDETQDMVPEDMEDPCDQPSFKSGEASGDGLSVFDVYGPGAKPEFSPTRLLMMVAKAQLDEQGRYEAGLMGAIKRKSDLLPSMADAGGFTLLHIATIQGAAELIEFLLQTPGVQVDAKDIDGFTPLMRAVTSQNIASLKLLLETGADITAKNNKMRNAAHLASKLGDPEVLRLLLKTLPRDEVNAGDEEGITALFETALQGNAEYVKQLLEAGADQSLRSDGFLPLHVAAQAGHIAVVRLLLQDNQSLVNIRGKTGQTPLSHACAFGRPLVAQALMDAGADLGLQDQNGFAALHWSAKNGFAVIVKELIARGSPLNFSRCNLSCLQLACGIGHLEVAKLLVHNGADVFFAGSEGHNAFSAAARHGRKEILEFLLSQPTPPQDVGRRAQCLEKARQIAVLNNHPSILEALVGNATASDNLYPERRLSSVAPPRRRRPRAGAGWRSEATWSEATWPLGGGWRSEQSRVAGRVAEQSGGGWRSALLKDLPE